MKKEFCWVATSLVFMLSLSSATVVAHDFELDAVIGLDSNPNKLTSDLDLDNGGYGMSRFEFSHMPTRTGYYYQLEARTDIYKTGEETTVESNSEDFTGKVELGYKWRPKNKHGRSKYKWELNYNEKDSIFVDRSSGDVPVFNGTPVGERFDASWVGFDFSGTIPISNEAEFIFNVDFKNKEYESYEEIGLSNLNYKQANLDIGFEKEIWSKVFLKTMIGYSKRQYEDRRAREKNKALIPDTDLEYTYLEAVNAIEYRFAKRWKFEIGLDIDQRQDNEKGYYDSTQAKLITRLRYRNSDYVKFLFSARYLKRRYDEIGEDPAVGSIVSPGGIDDEELEKSREGVRVRAEFIRRLVERGVLTLDLIMGIEYDSFENSNPVFSYDRGQTYVGLRWTPY
ncbi:MAG: hypothetical protein ACRBCS_00835 [Cellvibrionaceae bacterium]